MAPPVPVLTASTVRSKYKEQLENPQGHDCTLKELTQHQCTFRTHENAPPEIICLPFKRVFQRCLIRERSKRVKERWVNIEVTTGDTNADLFSEKRYAEDVQEFMSAERDFQRQMSEWERS